MKKWLSILLSALMIVTMLPMGAIAVTAATDETVLTVSEEPTIVVSDVTGKPGETVTVSVSMKNNPGIVSARVLVGYDATALTLKEYAMGDFSANGYGWSSVSNNPFVINWIDMLNPDNTADLLATLTFEIKEDAVLDIYPLALIFDCEGDIFNANWDTVYFAADEGSVTVEAGEIEKPDVSDDPDVPDVPDVPGVPDEPDTPIVPSEPVIEISDVTGVQGDTIDVAVSMKNNPGLKSTKVKVLFDNTVLELKAYKAGDFSASGYSWSKVENANANGGFVINWCDAISGPSTAELLATLTFEIKADAVPGTYTLGLEYSEDDLYTTDYENVAFGAAEGSVKILCDHEYDAVCDPSCNKCGETRDVHTDNIIHFDAVDPACHYNGNIEYWFCPDCVQFWADAALTQSIGVKNTYLPATGGGNLQHVEAKEPTCLDDGNVEYWLCADCEQFWLDEALTRWTNSKNVWISAIGNHTYAHACDMDCNVCGDVRAVDPHSYSTVCDPVCDVCGFDRSDIEAPAYAEVQKPTVVVVGGVGRAGDTITVPIYLKKNPGLQSAKVKVGYDTSVLTLTEYEAGDFSANGYSWNYGEPLIVNWCNAIDDPTTVELLATLTFRIWDNAKEGVYPITLEFSCEDDFYTTDFVTVEFEKQESFIYISTLQEHTYDNACDVDCAVCGGVRAVDPHPYVGKITVAATCVTDGVMTYTCSVCGDSYTEIIVANGSHTYDNACDAECNVCGDVDATRDHTYSNDLDHDCERCGHARATLGDSNGDGKVNNKDLGLLQQYLNELDVKFVVASGDINDDGRINNKDLGLMQQYLNEWAVIFK